MGRLDSVQMFARYCINTTEYCMRPTLCGNHAIIVLSLTKIFDFYCTVYIYYMSQAYVPQAFKKVPIQPKQPNLLEFFTDEIRILTGDNTVVTGDIACQKIQ